ncbi:MAG TPA: hypothetical protein VF981_07985 [Gemmatimonadaceae bacterium]
MLDHLNAGEFVPYRQYFLKMAGSRADEHQFDSVPDRLAAQTLHNIVDRIVRIGRQHRRELRIDYVIVRVRAVLDSAARRV